MKTIGILTSGGDAPGMNAAIRAAVLSAQKAGIRCLGFERGFNGLIDCQYRQLKGQDVKHISHLGGTILKSARSPRFLEEKHQNQAVENVVQLQLDGLIVVGGDGSFKGANLISDKVNIPVVGIPGTIDNDIPGTDYTIGFHTAVQTATEAIDKIRDTADALERIFIVEVMGHKTGYLALEVGITTEAEQIIFPEMQLSSSQIIDRVTNAVFDFQRQFPHASYIVVIAEYSCEDKNVTELAEILSENTGVDCRAVVLGHIQRGGKAISQDRILATKLGHYAVSSLITGKSQVMVGIKSGKLCLTNLDKANLTAKPLDESLLEFTV